MSARFGCLVNELVMKKKKQERVKKTVVFISNQWIDTDRITRSAWTNTYVVDLLFFADVFNYIKAVIKCVCVLQQDIVWCILAWWYKEKREWKQKAQNKINVFILCKHSEKIEQLNTDTIFHYCHELVYLWVDFLTIGQLMPVNYFLQFVRNTNKSRVSSISTEVIWQ